MKNFTNFFLATLLLLSVAGNVFAYDFSAVCSSGQTLYYNILGYVSNHKAEVTYACYDQSNYYFGFTKPTGNLEIPSSVIDPSSGLQYSVTSIGDYAFYGCSRLTSVTIPNSVTKIGRCAFSACSGVTTVNFNATNCTNMIKPNGISCNTNITTLNIGENVTYIPDSAFYGCRGLTSITIPNSVTRIGSWAFWICSGLTTVNFNATNCTTMASNVFVGCSSISTLNIGSSVTKIPANAFTGCSELTTVNFNATNCTTASSVFSGCSSFSTLNIGSSVTKIPASAFYGCSGLTSVTIPNSVTNIGNSAFSGCSGLTTVNFNAENCTYMGDYESSNYTVFRDCLAFTTLNIGENVTKIPNYAFYGCSGLTSVTIPNSVTSIGTSAFCNCSGLTSVTIPNSVTSIGASAFRNCSGLTSVTIPNSVTSIDNRAFCNCSGLTSVNFNATNCTSMGSSSYSSYSVFVGCTSLSTLNIGENVTNIPNYAFVGCSGLTDIYVNRMTPPTTYANSFSEYTATLWVPCGSAETYRAASVWRNFNDIRERLQYNLTVLSDNTQQGTASIIQQDCVESTATIEAAPNEGYIFAQWNDGNTDNPRNITVTQDVTYTAYFLSAYNITVASADETMGSVTGGGSYTEGTQVEISASANEHYHFVQWNDGNTDNPRTITVTGDATYTATFAIDQHTITVESADETMGTVSESNTYDYGTEIQISATATEHYHFVEWNDGNTDNPRTFTVTSDSTFTATFAIDQHTITVESNDETMGTVSEDGTYDYGTEIQISATAAEHYHFVEWNDGNTDNPRTITVTGDATYTATFAIDRFAITVESNDETMGTASESGEYDYGTEMQISATPADHYHFVQWNDGNIDNPRTITVTSDSTFTATFAIDQHTITVESNSEAMGSVSEGGTYDYGTEIQILATANEGYGFAAWNDGNTDNPRTITVTGDATYTATFGVMYTITVLSADETMGTVSEGGVYVEGSQVEISANAAEHYHFVQWNDENTDNPRTITVTSDSTFTATFAIDQHTITVESADTSMGTVSESGTYDYGTEIQISATANEHYHFVQWSDGNTDNPRNITVTGDVTYTAQFAPDQYTITVESADETMGTVTGGGTFDYGTERQISATALSGYQFAQWSDGNTDNPRTITVTGDATYVASFIPATGIEENASLEISLFPNPANDILNITSSETISEIEIVNTLGQVVKRIEVNADNAVCDVEDLTSGVYVVRIHTKGTVVSQRKFVKE
ncbi:MAG: leucine-rich repeat protein [Bacteroidales bacterium]|nr:leucine-rich repeat protein [Bacteroidales bacterium]